MGTHHNPSDVLTKFVQAAVLGQHLPKLNLFNDPALSQVLKYGLGVEKIKTVKSRNEEFNDKKETSLSANHVLSRVCQQACSQHHGQRFVQGQVCVLNFKAFGDQRDSDCQDTATQECFSPDEKSFHPISTSKGAYCQIQEIQATQMFNMKIICSLKD